jgi:hypothetical protein
VIIAGIGNYKKIATGRGVVRPADAFATGNAPAVVTLVGTARRDDENRSERFPGLIFFNLTTHIAISAKMINFRF